MAEIGGSASTKIIGVSVLLTWNVMDIEKNVALDLLDGYQFDNVGEDFRVGEPVVDIGLGSSVVWSELDADNPWSGRTLLVNEEEDAKLGKCLPGRNIALEAFWCVEERL